MLKMKYYEDFLKLEVFSLEEAQKVVGSIGNAKVLLNSYVKKGLVKRVRRNLYCVVNLEHRDAAANRYIIGSKINKSAYLTHNTAFDVHGLSHQVNFVVYVASASKISDFEFEGVLYKYVGKGIDEGVTFHRSNEKIKLTDIERTVVDSIDRTDYCGGPHELDEILNVSDRIAVIYEGAIVAIVDPKKTTEQELGLLMAGSKVKEAGQETNV